MKQNMIKIHIKSHFELPLGARAQNSYRIDSTNTYFESRISETHL